MSLKLMGGVVHMWSQISPLRVQIVKLGLAESLLNCLHPICKLSVQSIHINISGSLLLGEAL